MKLNSIKLPTSRTRVASAMAFALFAISGAAFAAGGNVTAISATPNSVFANESVGIKVNVTEGSFGVDCSMRWMVLDANKVEVKGGTHRLQKDANSAEYSTNFSIPTPGIYTVQVLSGPPSTQTTSCGGLASTVLTIKDKFAVNANPGLMASPSTVTRPASPVVVQPPAAVLQVTTLTSIKQVANTGNSGETWIEVQGTGNCNFSIASAGVAAQNFASSAAKPFPVKVKIAGAPLGSHQWNAKGISNCSGAAYTTFSVK